ncbi:hypothetical protein DOTSEDRAFT_24751 [Dothistroma septosporum NZE10]|uniref:Uncharacterized protein n=1 Tax=Dothistroma septosporum (strain NZE10 / CBS 128990) TaxID=675120 RepID=N1PMV0_DOTSN|nr:hypothetical protein DOTSEDRAFT_24751 [Dothistroma septosporum NZE10]
MECNHIRTSSASTGGGRERALSVVSEGYRTSTTAPTSPATSLPDHNSPEDNEILEIGKDTFEANIQHVRKDSCQSEKSLGTNKPDTNAIDELKVIDGSTLGGNDPLHSYIRAYNVEPRSWTEERQREERKSSRPPTSKRKRSAAVVNSSYLDPDWYDILPYSRQDLITSGLDMEADPERTSEQFWEKVRGAWNLSMRFESVEERREGFETDWVRTEPSTPHGRGAFRQTWFEEELTVGETW